MFAPKELIFLIIDKFVSLKVNKIKIEEKHIAQIGKNKFCKILLSSKIFGSINK